MMSIDPRRSLVAGLIWLVVALAASFAVAASFWAGRAAREIVVQQHVRRLLLETDQLGSDLGQAVSSRISAARTPQTGTSLERTYTDLVAQYPNQGWFVLADETGTVVAGDGSFPKGTSVIAAPWFSRGREQPWIGVIGAGNGAKGNRSPLLGDLSLPIRDSTGRTLGVAAAHLTWRWSTRDVLRLSAGLEPSAQTLILDGDGRVTVGPKTQLDRRWEGISTGDPQPIATDEGAAAALHPGPGIRLPRFERLPGGQTVLVARSPVTIEPDGAAPGWQVQLSEPKERVYQRANALAVRILWISVCLGAATALAGALGARHLTNRLRRLTLSAASIGRNEIERIEVPDGRDEVAQLAGAFAKVLDDLRRERSELLTLSGELERRVALRTREVERLAEESRYAAIVRERLNIARDLHDTLAHSMMAMLSEVRLLRKLQAHDPGALPEELAHAEQVAHDGLNEARTAIAQMRLNAVRDTGLGPALSKAFDRFIDRSGLIGEFSSDSEAARFGDERAETLFRIAEEALRNVERHAMANRVTVKLAMKNDSHLCLQIEDDGIGFDTSLSRPGHFGLVGLREQAQLIDAELHIRSALHEGTTISVTLRVAPEVLWPLDAAACSSEDEGVSPP
ncbi:MAG TPA: histidine kinase [Steroidobacteraceae bacterium]|nr:histidine kinase [Steroidobacteraceae bacterium]